MKSAPPGRIIPRDSRGQPGRWAGATAAHIHSGGAGVSGPVRVTLFDGPTTGAMDGVLAEGTFGSADVSGIEFDALVEEMKGGTAHVYVHPTDHPDGLIRAQIRLQMQ